MAGQRRHDRLERDARADEAAAAGAPVGLGLDLTLAPTKPPALHDGDGWIDFGPAGGSYYYSRTRDGRAAARSTLDGDAHRGRRRRPGSTTSGATSSRVGGGGWDWFAVNLDDGTDLTLSLVRDADGTLPARLRHARRCRTGRRATSTRDAFTVEVDRPLDEPDDRRRLPGRLADRRSRARTSRSTSTPTVADQELDTRATTGVVYWEGSQVVSATRDGAPLGGEAYVELTGYAPSTTARALTARASRPSGR